MQSSWYCTAAAESVCWVTLSCLCFRYFQLSISGISGMDVKIQSFLTVFSIEAENFSASFSCDRPLKSTE